MERQWSVAQQNIFRWFRTGEVVLLEGPVFREHVTHSQHLIVEARAGTGKTTTIIEAIKHAFERNIMVCAFSKVIEQEITRRLPPGNARSKTLHAIGLSCVTRFKEGIKVQFGGERAELLTERVCGKTTPDAIKKLVTTLHTKGREIAPHANRMGDLEEIAIKFDCEPDEQWENSSFGLDFVEARALEAMELASNIKSGDIIDGSDMIFLPVRNKWLMGMYDLVVVDEAQDMTTAQLEIAKGILKPGGRICVVGDDRQAIFGWRGADVDSLDRLRKELFAETLRLTTTYRCGRAIVEEAQRLVPDFEAGESNSDGVIEYVNNGDIVTLAKPGDFILSRVNAPLVALAMRFFREGRRARILGQDIGKSLVALTRKLKASSVPDFIRKLEAWRLKEVRRQEIKRDAAETESRKRTFQEKINGINDKADMLLELTDGAKNVDAITAKIEGLFKDDGLGAAGLVTLSSVHKAKGLEADKVFVMRDTIRNYSKEEENIEYVAITRAKNTLVYASEKYGSVQEARP